MSRTKKALALLRDNSGMTVAAACAAAGVSDSAVYRALKNQKATVGMRCKHCGSLLPYLKDAIDTKKR